jgi:hypothetical protein
MGVQRTMIELGVGVPDWPAFSDPGAAPAEVAKYGGQIWFRTPTVFAALRWLGASVAAAYAGQAASGAAAALAVVMAWRSRADMLLKGAALAVSVFLATPYAFDYDMVILLFAAAWLTKDALDNGAVHGGWLTAVALFLLPLLMLMVPARAHLQIAPLFLWPALLALVHRCLAADVPRRPTSLRAATSSAAARDSRGKSG